jgi:uncharacterized protein YqfA (UPF0365 family)
MYGSVNDIEEFTDNRNFRQNEGKQKNKNMHKFFSKKRKTKITYFKRLSYLCTIIFQIYDDMDAATLIIFLVSLFLFLFILWMVPVGLWFNALLNDVRISLLQLVLMRWRKVPPSLIVNAMITGTKAGIRLNRDQLEAHYLAGGHVTPVVNALISADKANIPLDFKAATAIDLAGRNILEAIQTSVNPKVIDTPSVAAMAKDGIQLIAKARVTVRTNIKQLVGGAGEETIIARVGEGIVSAIGSAESHKQVLENPDSISKLVLNKGLDSGTAFEILSIDIADVDVGKNIGAYLQMDQANADKNIAQAKAEERRAMAVALEQEMNAKAQEARAKVILAETEIPLAIADAFRSGNLGVMDYYKLENIKADTQMREKIGKPNQAKKITDNNK